MEGNDRIEDHCAEDNLIDVGHHNIFTLFLVSNLHYLELARFVHVFACSLHDLLFFQNGVGLLDCEHYG